MGGRTDYTPRDVFVRRAEHLNSANTKYMGETKVLIIKYDTDFDKFAANVALALKPFIVYRTDDGKYARGLVRANGDLKHSHDDLSVKVPAGQTIRLLARLYRRRDPAAANRWVLAIQFALPTNDMVQGDNLDLFASKTVSDNSRRALAEQMVHDLTLYFHDEHRFPGIKGDRVRAMLEIADRIGYPKNLDLWCYAAPAVYQYVIAGDQGRKAMTVATGGKVPFDGHNGYAGRYVPWRIYPLRDAAKQCSGQSSTFCRNNAANQLINAEEQINISLVGIRQEKARYAGVPTWVPGSWAGSPMLGTFLHHIDALKKDRNSLYSVFQ